MTALSDSPCPVIDPTARAAHAEAAALRAMGPATPVELPGGVRAWSVTRHSVIQKLTSDPRVSRDPRRHWPGIADVPQGWPLAVSCLMQNFLNAYGEEHRKLRRRMAPSFSPRRVEALRPQIQSTADRLIDALDALERGESTDVRRALSLPLTMTVICDLFGVPDFLRERLGASIDALMDTTADPEQGQARLGELNTRLVELLAYKKAHPSADFTSDLLAPAADGEAPLTDGELLDHLFLMLAAGYETAVNLITSAVHALLSQPEHLALVRLGTIGWDDVIEETLRHNGPIMHHPMRYAIEDIDLGEGVVIRRGEPVIIAFAAAGRDPGIHPERPDAFDPTRAGKDHLAFGHGPHFCLGAHLARLETRIALTTLFERFPHLALAHPDQPPLPVPSLSLNGPAQLHVVPHPRQTPATGG
ncbi:cytochrome P450 family protein [Streptomyces albipurpureus]|uniref:Cytochrome P450 n=1 Tax=Streptomyces albipurpureus TaxID=2897419 RepID=A0ABT0UYY7_9ACTN|nr:cytochrome P450 [Streptomyces sp. CWNU-1]MCM2393689.1 cytochrome P450 [Streptomyces sp. CWNU-1]